MVGQSKILTVSYGTFSCTLEGFDEPFSTMKAIAEYFRDLAAEDRYFGAEPPTPDAEMLHRIAEREIKRRVEAQVQDNGVILRPQLDAPAAEATPEVATDDAAPGDAAPVAETAPSDDAMSGPEVAPAAEEPMADATGAGETPEEEGPAEDASLDDSQVEPTPTPTPAAQVAGLVAAAPFAGLPGVDHGAASGISAKLQRIRDAVAQARRDETAPVTAAPVDTMDADAVDAARIEEEARLAAEEAERAEAERLAAEEAERAEAERLAAEEAERAEAERAEAERARDTVEAEVAAALGDSGLNDEDEATLVSALAEIERDAASLRDAQSRAGRQAFVDGTGEPSLDRLSRQADTALSGADAQRRQSTIAHLKAAVAATRAEAEAAGRSGAAARDEDDTAPYRQDLEHSVRGPAPAEQDEAAPRRPVRPTTPRSERPKASQPPLVLVSEQRIDRPETLEVVRPRRVAASALAMEELFDEETEMPRAQIGRGYTDFVAPMHLTTVIEMVEAAAAYITHVEGLDEFTRPQVMRYVMATETPVTRSRENLLRAFGMLMREGKLRRARRGQFELSADSAFAEPARRFAAQD